MGKRTAIEWERKGVRGSMHELWWRSHGQMFAHRTRTVFNNRPIQCL